MEIVLIGDPRIKQVKVNECGDAFVDFAEHYQELTFDLERHHVQKKSKSISFGRKKVGEMLLNVQASLPPGIRLLIKECYRPLSIQKEFFEGYSSYLRKKFPEWNEEQVYTECSKLNAPVDVAPHSTGGAVDLTLIDSAGNWLEMGSEFNADPLETDYATYTEAQNISEIAKNNRKILSKAMSDAGFVNYPTEWWHWSYGDKYWAFSKQLPNAIFSSIEDFPNS
jgi:D-alanyl-D-alanine dipeptidase